MKILAFSHPADIVYEKTTLFRTALDPSMRMLENPTILKAIHTLPGSIECAKILTVRLTIKPTRVANEAE